MSDIHHAVNVLASQFNSTIQRAVRDQRIYVESLEAQQVRDGQVHGYVEIASAGECVVDIEFPIMFIDKPLFTVGLELGENTFFTYGHFPTWSATVGSWQTTQFGDMTVYVGAQLGVVIFESARSILHYSFQGRSFTTPTAVEASIGGTL
jgi:hypothetical protein